LTAVSLDIATCMYYTGIDPFTSQQVYAARNLRDRKMQRALQQFFKPDNYFMVRNYKSMLAATIERRSLCRCVGIFVLAGTVCSASLTGYSRKL
jgi:hypothetical protein